MRCTSALILLSRLPASPPSLKWRFFWEKPPVAELRWKGHRKLEAALKLGPHVTISWMMSSTHTMPAELHRQ